MAGQRILMIEDEFVWIELVLTWLKHSGYANVEYAMTGADAIDKAIKNPPECVLLDLELPDQNGMEVCQKLRALPVLTRVPIVLFTGHKREKVLGLQSGADYFVTKDEKPHELLATLEAIFRRRQMEEGLLTRGPLTLRSSDRRVFWGQQPSFELSPKMFTLFYVLVERGPQPVSRADLYRLVENAESSPLSRALDVLLNRLRKVLPADLSSRLVNVKGFGYVFLESAPAASVESLPEKKAE